MSEKTMNILDHMKQNFLELNHVLPKGEWENYLKAIVTTMLEDIPPLKKTVRLQKIMRFIYDNEVKDVKND